MDVHQVGWAEAFKEEIPIIKDRRYGDVAVPDETVKQNLVGLAISGGGIRSATFALGVLEGLRLLRLLPRIDYLSTVSGGGYIGAWLSANCKRAAEKNRPSWLTMESDWKLSVGHLRRYSNYLSPTLGFFSADTWSVGAIWLRNTILVQLTAILAIAVALLLPRPLFDFFGQWPNAGHWRWATILLFILGAVGIAGNHLRFSSSWGVKFLQGDRWLLGLIPGVMLLGAAIWLKIHFNFDPFSNEKIRLFPAISIAFLLIGGCFCLQPVTVKLVGLGWLGNDKPQQLNYTQGWVQGLVVLPMMAVGFLVAAILWGQSQWNVSELAKVDTFGGFFANAWQYWPFPLAVVFASLWLFSICSIRDRGKYIAAAMLAPIPAMLVLHILLSAIMLLLHNWARMGDEGRWLAYIWGPPMVLYAFSLTVVILIGMLGRQSLEGVREWWSRLGAWLIIYGIGWMTISAAASYGPWLSALLFRQSTWKWGASIGGGWVGTTLAGLWAGNSNATGKSSVKTTREKTLEFIARTAPFVFIAGLLVAIASVLHLTLISNSGISWADATDLGRRHWTLMKSANFKIVFAVLGVCLGALLLLAARVDINEFSLNAFYRSRLIRCYLGATRFQPGERQPQSFTGFDDGDDLPLAKFTPEPQTALAGPFHIVNCSLNLGGSKDLALHTRHSAIFTMTPLRCGSRYESRDQTGQSYEVGYAKTRDFGGEGGQPTLGQAIAVSGAAASPNMGYHTSPVVAFLMTLFNVRLGWWFPNPQSKTIDSPSPWFSLRYLLTELFGGANDKSSYLAISDGGHFENLAAYELVKRRCRVIIISDAECDPKLHFEGLGSLVRMCDVDFGYKITIDVNAIRPGESGWSSRRCAVGSIDYGNGVQGTLIYLKASMTGREETDIVQYKSAHPSFPHESTSNQFYAEDQFESYRNLGRDIAMRTFEPAVGSADLDSLASALTDIWSPTLQDVGRFAKHGARLSALWSKLGQSQHFDFLDKEIMDGWPQTPATDFRSAFYLCSEMIQLMESVYLDLHLEETWDHPDHAGWQATFKRWARSAAIQETWQLTCESYGLRFRYFWDRRLRPATAAGAVAANA